MDIHHIKTTVILEQDIKSIASLPYSATKSGETSPLPVWKERIQYESDMSPEILNSRRRLDSTFSWQWHIVVMATGTCSSLIHNFPYHNESVVLKAVALSLFLFDLVLFFLLCAWAVTRCTMFPKVCPYRRVLPHFQLMNTLGSDVNVHRPYNQPFHWLLH